jgi:enoyl-CoA hydratase/carnithine racemase
MGMFNDFCAIDRLKNGAARLTIANTGKTTVLNSRSIDGLMQGLHHLSGDADLRLLVLTATGDRTFIAGADMREMITLNPETGAEFISRLRDLCDAIRNFPVPVVARIAGWCLGGGLELAMACDLRVVSSTAQFAMPEVRVGVPSVIHAALLPRIVGWGRARWLLLTGATLDAATALSWGLVDVVATPDALDAELEKAIQPILECGPQVIRAQKILLRKWEDLSLSESIAASVQTFAQSFSTGEPQQYMNEALLHRSSHKK